MKNSSERIQYITSYLSSYKAKIEMLNKEGLFDAAKLFELFAKEVCRIYFGQNFANLNIETPTFPYVDLLSEDGILYVQVSTAKDVPTKIKSTLENIRDSKQEFAKKISNIVFFVLDNESIKNVKNYTGKNRIGHISFTKSKNVITTQDILKKATQDFEFQTKIYELFKKDDACINSNLSALKEAIANSRALMNLNINSFINNEYEIDRSEFIDKIFSDDNKNISVIGEAGSGKSVICKKLVEKFDVVIYAKADSLTFEKNINDVWGFNIRETLKYLKGQEVVFFIDALEFIADVPEKMDLLTILYDCTQEYSNVKILTSCRSSDKNAFVKLANKFEVHEYEVGTLTVSEQEAIAERYPIIKKIFGLGDYKKLIEIPFYVNIIIEKVRDIENIKDENALRTYIWRNVICDNSQKKEQIIYEIVFKRAKEFTIGVHASNFDRGVINELVSKGIIVNNEDYLRLKYDIFEDICFEQFFDIQFDKCKGEYNAFFEHIQSLGRCSYRRFQIWIDNKLWVKGTRNKFIYELVFSQKTPMFWKKQMQIGLVKSRHSAVFFEEYEDYLSTKDNLISLLDIINLYAFAIISDGKNFEMVFSKAIGDGRKSLLKIVYKKNIYKYDDIPINKLVKLCNDYVLGENKDEDANAAAGAILVYFLEGYIGKAKERHIEKNKELQKIISSIYILAPLLSSYIKELWERMMSLYKDGTTDEKIFSREFFNYTISFNKFLEHTQLIRMLSNELCSLAEFYWTYEPKCDNEWHLMCRGKDELAYRFGLSECAQHYEWEHGSSRNNIKENTFFALLFKFKFWDALNWTINFINKGVDYLNDKQKLNEYSIFFVEENISKSYLGYDNMWLATTDEHRLPLVFSDLLFCLKEELIYVINNDIVKDKKTIDFANNVKQTIINKSNNIALLSIIVDIGLEFSKKLPGYALDLASNIDLVLLDLNKYSFLLPNSTRDVLEKQIMLTLGVPGALPDRYNKKRGRKSNLREYFTEIEAYKKDLTNKCYKILDYLYSIVSNDEENATRYLQIEYMDLRKAEVVNLSEDVSVLIPTATGAAKELTKLQDDENKHVNEVVQKLNNYNKQLGSLRELDIDQHLEMIELILSEIERNPIKTEYQRLLVQYIVIALGCEKLLKKDREELCVGFVLAIRTIFENEGFNFDYKLIMVLIKQLDVDIDSSVKNEIKKIVFDFVRYHGQNGVIYTISNIIRNYLRNNAKLSILFFNTLVKLAEDEMLHQLYNAQYINEHKELFENKNLNFIPNGQASLKGVDYYLSQNKDKKYESRMEEIIKDYLFDEKMLDLSKFDITKHDIQILCYAINCGVSLNDPYVFDVTKQIILQIIQIWHNDKRNYSAHDILDTYCEGQILDFLKYELIHNSVDNVFKLMFEGVDFDNFTVNTIQFYQRILSATVPFYFDSYNNPSMRFECQNIIKKLEGIINFIANDFVKNELTKSLIMFIPEFEMMGDWSKCITQYSYTDKMFLSEMFEKYGGEHLEDLFLTIYKLQIKYLLPEILIPLNIAIVNSKELNKQKKQHFEKIIEDNKTILLIIVSKAYFDFNKEIKADVKITEAYENILEIMIELNYQEAALLLDEFRIH